MQMLMTSNVSLQVRTVIPANISFVEDCGEYLFGCKIQWTYLHKVHIIWPVSCKKWHLTLYNANSTARILRGVRIAARLGFRFTKDIAHSVRELSCSVLRLDKVFKSLVPRRKLIVLLNHVKVYHDSHFFLLPNVVGKDTHGNELHASLWVRRSFLEVIMEIWTPGDTSTHTSMGFSPCC